MAAIPSPGRLREPPGQLTAKSGRIATPEGRRVAACPALLAPRDILKMPAQQFHSFGSIRVITTNRLTIGTLGPNLTQGGPAPKGAQAGQQRP